MNSLMKNDVLLPTMSNVLEDFFAKDLLNWSGRNLSDLATTLPSVNIQETPKDFTIELAAPGLKKNDFKVELENNVLTISSEKEEEKSEKDKKGNFTRKEYSYESFCRSFNLPDTANDDKIEASYKDGILSVVVAKKQISSPKSVKAISIK